MGKKGKKGVTLPPQVLKEILSVPGQCAIKGQHGFLIHDTHEPGSKTILELFAGTCRLSTAFKRHCLKEGIGFKIEAYEYARGGTDEDLLEQVRA